MKKILILCSIFILASCSSKKIVSKTNSTDGSSSKTISESSFFGKKDLVKLKEDWEYEMIVATGEAPVLNKYEEESRNKLLAKKGAILDAERKLAEKIGTTRLNANSTMEDFSTNDFVQTKINMELKGVSVIKEQYNKVLNVYEVTVQMPKLKIVHILEEYLNK